MLHFSTLIFDTSFIYLTMCCLSQLYNISTAVVFLYSSTVMIYFSLSYKTNL